MFVDIGGSCVLEAMKMLSSFCPNANNSPLYGIFILTFSSFADSLVKNSVNTLHSRETCAFRMHT